MHLPVSYRNLAGYSFNVFRSSFGLVLNQFRRAAQEQIDKDALTLTNVIGETCAIIVRMPATCQI